MNLQPARIPNETFADYKYRRKWTNAALDRYLRFGIPCRPYRKRTKLGKAGTKQAKRLRRLLREARHA